MSLLMDIVAFISEVIRRKIIIQQENDKGMDKDEVGLPFRHDGHDIQELFNLVTSIILVDKSMSTLHRGIFNVDIQVFLSKEL